MLQSIGDAFKNKKLLSWLILVPLAAVFAVWGATGAVSLDFIGPKDYAVKVDGHEIPLEEANRRWQDQQAQWQQQFATNLPEDMRASLQEGVIERLIRAELLDARTREAGYRVDGGRLQAAIRSEEAFQVDGRYSETLALARLAQVGVSAEQYRADILRGLQGEELQRALFLGEFLTPTEIGRRLALEGEQREIRYALMPAARYRTGLALSDAELAGWYQKNGRRFLTPESVRLQYAEASTADVEGAVVVAESDLLDLFAANKDRYIEPERRRARHILLATEKEARDVLTQLQGGADFAALARKVSKDTGSAEGGGDLGFSGRDAFVAPFAEALFAMKPGELRGPVKTEFGFHVIRLEGTEAGRNKTFEEVRGDLEAEYRRNRVSDLFGEKQDEAQRRLEQPGADLAKVASDLGMRQGEVATFLRGAGAPELGDNADLQALVFGDAVLNQRRIGGPIALGDDRFLLVRVLEHRKPVVPPLDAVRAQVQEAALQERAADEARKAAASIAAAVTAGTAFEAAVKSRGGSPEAARFIDRRDPSVPAEVRAAAFELARPSADKPQVKALRTANGDAAVVLLSRTRVLPAAGDAAARALRGQELAGRQGQGVVAAYIDDLRGKADITRNPQAFQ